MRTIIETTDPGISERFPRKKNTGASWTAFGSAKIFMDLSEALLGDERLAENGSASHAKVRYARECIVLVTGSCSCHTADLGQHPEKANCAVLLVSGESQYHHE